MEHIRQDYDFSQVIPMKEFSFDLSLATQPSRLEELKSFVVSYYQKDHDILPDGRFPETAYRDMISAAIAADNLEAVNVLWKGMAVLGPDYECPDYAANLCTAADRGSLRMFQHILWATLNYAPSESVPDIYFSKLIQWAAVSYNQPVLDYIGRLRDAVTNRNGWAYDLLPHLPFAATQEIPDPEDPKKIAFVHHAKEFYAVLEACNK